MPVHRAQLPNHSLVLVQPTQLRTAAHDSSDNQVQDSLEGKGDGTPGCLVVRLVCCAGGLLGCLLHDMSPQEDSDLMCA